MKKSFFHFLLVALAVAATWIFCFGLSEIEILENSRNLTMREWLFEERGVVVKSNSPKVEKVFQFMVVSNHELKRTSELDALWVSYAGGENLYFLLTDNPPSVR
jgi:hypothetical protein